MTNSEQAIHVFWDWFHSISDVLRANYHNETLRADLADHISRLGRFGWELGPGYKAPEASSLVITPCGDPDLLPGAQRIIDAAPALEFWEFYPAKPPKRWERKFYVVDNEGVQRWVDASQCEYVALRYPDGKFEIILVDRAMAQLPPDLRDTAAVILVDGELGEAQRMRSIARIEVVAKVVSHLANKRTRIEFLSRHFRDLLS